MVLDRIPHDFRLQWPGAMSVIRPTVLLFQNDSAGCHCHSEYQVSHFLVRYSLDTNDAEMPPAYRLRLETHFTERNHLASMADIGFDYHAWFTLRSKHSSASKRH